VRTFFTRHLRHVKGELRGQLIQPQPWIMNDVVRPLFDTQLPDKRRQYRTVYVEVPRKNAKRLALDTLLPTPTGWIKMADVAVGTVLFDEQGHPCHVTHVWPVVEETNAYRVTFSDRTMIVADAEHLWLTIARRHGAGKRHGHGQNLYQGVRTTEQIRQTLWIDEEKREANHAVPVASPLQCPEMDFPLPPYVLGAWLGDGTSASGGFTCADPEIVEEIRREGVPVRHLGVHTLRYWLGTGERAQAARDESPQAILRSLGVLDRKHIPEAYLRGSIAQRVALLQGLMDTDGTVSKGQCVYTTTNPELRDGVLELLRSLGFKATLWTQHARLNRRIIGEVYDLQFWAFADRPVFRLPRKRARQKRVGHPTRSRRRKIVGVEPTPSVPMRCLAVDSPSHLYLAGEAMIPTHNSTIMAGLGLFLLYYDNEPGAEIVSAAADRAQAGICFDIAREMVESDPYLSKVTQIYRRELVVPHSGSRYSVISSEAYSKHGMNLHGAMIDEVHAHQDGGELWDVLTKGMGSRRQPLTFAITTAGYDRSEASLCWTLHQHALRVRAGTVEDATFLGVIYGAPDDADWTSPATWALANPGLGVTIKRDYLEQECRRAQEMTSYQNEFRRYHLNQWTESATAWLPLDKWDQGAEAVPAEALRGRPCYAGLDLSTTTDLSAFVMVFPREAGSGYDVKVECWCPSTGIRQRAARDRAPYDRWAREGWLESTEGDVVDYDVIRERIKALAEQYQIREIGYDPWNATQLVTQLQADGARLTPLRQTFKELSAASKELERLVREGALRHGGHPVLRWCLANTVVETDGPGNVKPSKKKSTERIDLTVALVMALACATREVDHASVYERRGVVAW
jgi:phage terminase large subunit-like protein